MANTFQVTFDCADPDRLARFWADVLGYQLQPPPRGFDSWEQWMDAHNIPVEARNSKSAVIDPEGKGPRMFFQQVSEPKTSKNRVYLDVNVCSRDASVDERKTQVTNAVERITKIGATRIRSVEELGEHWVVMTDPEGNEFCVQ